MFGQPIFKFDLLGFEVKADASWLLLAMLIIWSLARGVFPTLAPDLAPSLYWWMGIAGAIGLFMSIVFHELSHSLIARREGIKIKGITLFIFGGVAEMESEPPSAGAEFRMAIAGPIASAFLSLVFYAVFRFSELAQWPNSFQAVVHYLSWINGILAVFNMVPAFPLDGGRAFRAALWAWKGDLRAATKMAAHLGAFFAVFLMILGVVNLFSGNIIGGLWWLLIGLFLKNAAGASYLQVMTKRYIEGEPVSHFMTADPVAVTPDLTIKELVEDYIYHHHHEFFPVVDNDRLIGGISTREVKAVSRQEWERRTVREIMTPPTSENTIDANTDTLAALKLMNTTGKSRLMVAEGSHLVGIMTLKDLLKFLTLKMELEDEN